MELQPQNSTESDHRDRKSGAVLRVIDANLNRSLEALRVIEDTLRFVFCDQGLTARCKGLRHELGALAGEIVAKLQPAIARNATDDVGANSGQASEYVRVDVESIVQANFSRARQSMRTLEEYCKLLDRNWAMRVESVRYQVYELERAMLMRYVSQQRLEPVRLCVLLDGRGDQDAFVETVQQVLEGGASMLQLRDKQVDDRTLLARAMTLVELSRRTGALAIINDRIDVALAAGADGVHLGQEDLTVAAARKAGGSALIVGVSTHSAGQARQAVADGADYIGVGPVFASTTKRFQRFPGVALIREVVQAVAVPALAIGGITIDNVAQVIEAGLDRIAVSGAVLDSKDPVGVATRRLVNALSRSAASMETTIDAGN
jgi:thiamine-phosphate pyrophosphorylase